MKAMKKAQIYTRYNFELELKERRLPTGFYVIAGEQGAGKTSLATAIMSTDYKYHSTERLRIAQSHVNTLNSSGYKLRLPKHLYFSNIELSLDKSLSNARAVRTHCISVKNFGLPNADYEVQYFPYGSVIYISEADIWLYTQDWQKISKYVWNLIKYVRHNGLVVIFDVQVFDRLPIQLRKLCTDLIYIRESNYKPARFFGLIKQRTRWHYVWSQPQQQTAIAEMNKLGADIPSKHIAFQGAFNYKGNIYRQYDSYSGEMYFLNGIEKCGYAVRQHPPKSYTPDGVKEYCNALPLTSANTDEG